MLSKFKCAHCDKFTLYRYHKFTDQNGKVINRLCKPCSIEDDAAWEQLRQWEQEQQEAAEAQAELEYEIECEKQDILDSFCDHYGCWGELGYCQKHDQPEDDYDDHEEQIVCDGCGEVGKYGCVCAELASLARHNADPATRGSWWVA